MNEDIYKIEYFSLYPKSEFITTMSDKTPLYKFKMGNEYFEGIKNWNEFI